MNIIDAVKDKRLFGALPEFRDLSTWGAWLVCLKAIFALPMEPGELAVFQKFTGRVDPPEAQFKSAYLLCGRRGGKSLIAALVSVYQAVFVDWHLGLEKGYVMTIAVDRKQASVVFSYIKKILLEVPAFKGMVMAERAEELSLKNNVTLSVATASFRTLRGYKVLGAVCDEIGHYLVEGQNPAAEILTGLRPSLGGQPGSKLLCISTGFQKSGPLWEAYRDKYGKEDPDTLVWAASTHDMNPTYSEEVIQKALRDDYQAASVEYGIGTFFRSDLETYLSSEALEAVIVSERFELPRLPCVQHYAGVDPSGGSANGDAMTLSIAHREGERVVQDAIRVKQAGPKGFNPAVCVKEFAATLRSYGINYVTGDKYSGTWCSSQFEKEGILYRPAERTKSDYYLEFLPIVMQGGCELLDNNQQVQEFRGLLRRTGRGKDSIDHAPNAHDDVANACAVSIVEAGKTYVRDEISFGELAEPPLSLDESLERESMEWLLNDKPGRLIDPETDDEREYKALLREVDDELRAEFREHKKKSEGQVRRGW